MVVGSGLIAKAIVHHGANSLGDTCFYAAGVSNSGCKDEKEFLRECKRLDAAMAGCATSDRFVYFSTCSIEDPFSQDSEYVKHKIQMENRVRCRRRHLILRLPQVAGNTPNPHTLLNFLYTRMARSESFQIWGGATRNIIDVEDVAQIVMDLIVTEGVNAEIINIANPRTYTMLEIVRAMELTLRCRAVYDIVDKGAALSIDISRISASIERRKIMFGDGYLENTIKKYYGNSATH